MIHLDSAQRSSGTNAEPVFQLEHPISDVSGFRVVSVSIPRTYYTITSANNTFTLTDATISPVTHAVALSPGNYTGTSIASALQTLMNATGGSAHYVVTYSSSTYLVTITNGTDLFTMTWGVGTLPTNNLVVYLGFDPLTAIAGASTVTGTSCLNLSIDFALQIRSHSLTEGIKRHAIVGPNVSASTLVDVPMDVPLGDVIVYEPVGLNIRYLSRRKVERTIDLSLRDLYGNVLDLHGLPWRMTLEQF